MALPEGIVAADVNGDGKLDLLVTNTGDDTVGVLLGNGDGTFQPQVTYATDFGSAGIVVADFNMTGSSISPPPTSTAPTSASCLAMAMAPSRHKLPMPSVINPAR